MKTVNDIIDLANQLEFSPYMGRKIPEFNDVNRRELIYKSYRIMYKIEYNKVFIRRIWHSARELPKQLIS
jgi:plasmid stabilization system protein ParE